MVFLSKEKLGVHIRKVQDKVHIINAITNKMLKETGLRWEDYKKKISGKSGKMIQAIFISIQHLILVPILHNTQIHTDTRALHK